MKLIKVRTFHSLPWDSDCGCLSLVLLSDRRRCLLFVLTAAPISLDNILLTVSLVQTPQPLSTFRCFRLIVTWDFCQCYRKNVTILILYCLRMNCSVSFPLVIFTIFFTTFGLVLTGSRFLFRTKVNDWRCQIIYTFSFSKVIYCIVYIIYIY